MTNVKDRFVRLCEVYLLPSTNVRCSALDLYASRCSFLHSLGWESNLSREGKAKPIFYTFITNEPELAQKVIEHYQEPFIHVHADDLIAAAKLAHDRVKQAANTNKALAERLLEASGKQYGHLETKAANQLFGQFLTSVRARAG